MSPSVVAGPEIEVERHQLAPAWWATLDEALEQRVSVMVEDTDLDALLAYLRETTGVNFVAERSVYDDHAGEEYSYSSALDDVSVRSFLNLMCRAMR